MREEIIAGMKNALSRGQTLEQAAQSFVNAGYNPQEVRAAYEMMRSGASGMLARNDNAKEVKVQQQNVIPVKPNVGAIQPFPVPQSASVPTAQPIVVGEKKKSNSKMLIIMIVVSTLILLGALGYLFYILYTK